MRNSNTIKNLCIALEALSRIPDSYILSSRIQDLLKDALTEDETKPETVRPVHVSINSDDEIPF